MDERYWIAINGPGCAISPMAMSNPMLTPTPEQLFGFPTREEAERALRICVQSPMDEVRRFLKSLAPDVRSGRIRVIRPKHAQPLTEGVPAMWTEDTELHQAAQKAFINTMSN
jgi:hypothetical protein